MNFVVPVAASLEEFVFYSLIFDYLQREIVEFGLALSKRMMAWIGSLSLIVLTGWVLVQGYRIVTGAARESMTLLITRMAKACFIVGAATTMAMAGHNLHEILGRAFPEKIAHVITGKDESPGEQIDESLKWLQIAMSSIDAIDAAGDATLETEKNRNRWLVGIGAGGPALTGGGLLLMYQIGLALFVGFGPFFILCLLFDSTKQAFYRWLWYGFGTMFSMGVLAAMVSIAMKMAVKVAGALWVSSAAGKILGVEGGLGAPALQQGGLGIILTLLIVTTPVMAAQFFQGALGMFSAQSQIPGSTVPMGLPVQPGAPVQKLGHTEVPMGTVPVSPRMYLASKEEVKDSIKKAPS